MPHPRALEVKQELEALKAEHLKIPEENLPGEFHDERLDIINLLTEVRSPGDKDKDALYEEDYEKMWKNIEQAERNEKDNHLCWVDKIIKDIIYANKTPAYTLKNLKGRRQSISNVLKHSEALKKIYKENLYDEKTFPDDGQIIPFENLEGLQNQPDKVSIIDILDCFSNQLATEISEFEPSINTSGEAKVRRFIQRLAYRNRNISLFTIRVITYAITGSLRTESNISKIEEKAGTSRANSLKS